MLNSTSNFLCHGNAMRQVIFLFTFKTAVEMRCWGGCNKKDAVDQNHRKNRKESRIQQQNQIPCKYEIV